VAGQNLGAKRPERTAITPRAAAAVGLRVAVPLAILFLVAPRLLLGLFGLQDPVVLDLGQQFLAFLSLSALFVTVALSYTGALQGTGDTRSPMWITLVSQLALPLLWCAAFSALRGLRPTDIWIAIVLGHLTRAALSMLRFRAGKWRAIEVDIGD
jgi:Na+-driven multidrug efflux pump